MARVIERRASTLESFDMGGRKLEVKKVYILKPLLHAPTGKFVSDLISLAEQGPIF